MNYGWSIAKTRMSIIKYMKNNFFHRNLTFEFHKLRFSQLVLIFTILVCVNVIGTFIYVDDIDIVDVHVAIDEYITEPKPFLDSYYEWKISYDLYEQAIRQNAKLSASEAVIPDPPKQVYKSQVYDEQIYNRFFKLLYRKETYKTQITELIHEAEQNISDSAGNNYQRYYNSEIIRIYSKTANRAYIGLEDTRGWNIFLELSIPGLSVAVILLFVTGHMFCMEYSSGMNGIIFSSKYGRKKVLLTKLVCIFMLAFLLLATSESVTLLTIWKTVGLSSPFNGIQSFEQYTYCPYAISVLTYSVLSFLIRLCTLWIICLFTAVLAVWLQNVLLVYLLSGFSVVAAYVVLLVIHDSGSLSYRLHPFVHLTSTDFLKRYSASHIFMFNLEHKYVVPFIYFVIGAVMLCMVIFIRKNGTKLYIPRCLTVCNIVDKAKVRPKSYKTKTFTLSLTYYELKKQLQKNTIIICILMIAAQTLFTYIVYSGNHSEEDKILLEYMQILEGAVSEEKTEYLKKERANFNVLLSEKDMTEMAYSNGEITTEEYTDYLKEYERALSHTDILDIVIKRDKYLNKVSEGKASPACHIYNVGYENIVDSGDDILLLLIVFFLASEVFPCEYVSRTSVGSSAQLIGYTKRGRKPTDSAKVISAFVMSTVLYLITTGLRLTILYANWYLPTINAPFYSIERFAGVFDLFKISSISVVQFFVIYFIIRLLIILLLVFGILMLTKKIKDGRLIFTAFAVLITIPYIFDYIGVKFPNWLRLTDIYNLLI